MELHLLLHHLHQHLKTHMYFSPPWFSKGRRKVSSAVAGSECKAVMTFINLAEFGVMTSSGVGASGVAEVDLSASDVGSRDSAPDMTNMSNTRMMNIADCWDINQRKCNKFDVCV